MPPARLVRSHTRVHQNPASLKPLDRVDCILPVADTRVHQNPASLKRGSRRLSCRVGFTHPGSPEPGLIEAGLPIVRAGREYIHPGSPEPGLIEAPRRGAPAFLQNSEHPGSPEPGLIEAISPRVLGSVVVDTRVHQNPASLKRSSGCSAFRGCPYTRVHQNPASLKHLPVGPRAGRGRRTPGFTRTRPH